MATKEKAKTKAKTNAAPAKRDYVREAYECFVKGAADIDPTNPVKALEEYFRRNATDELKARCKAEGKTAAKCWEFVMAVARKALGGRNGHIDPGVVYAIAMHWFEDVPLDWRGGGAGTAARSDAAKPAKCSPRASAKVERAGKAAAAQKRAKAPESAKPAQDTKPAQGFFFNLLGYGDGAESGAAK